MAQTNLYIGKTTNNAGESEISMRLYISRDIRIRVSSGIWVDHKRWGKKNEINIATSKIANAYEKIIIENKMLIGIINELSLDVLENLVDKYINNKKVFTNLF